MSEAMIRPPGPAPLKRRFQLGLRGLLATILVLALICGWIAREHRRAQERTALVAELGSVGISPCLEEPTGLDFWIKKRIPGREAWVRDRIGEGWLSCPTVFVCWTLADSQVPYAVDRLRRLGTVREVHYQNGPLTETGIAQMRTGLPDVGVVPRANPSLQRYYLSKTTGEQFALSGLVFEAFLAIGLLGILSAIILPLVTLVVSRRRAAAERPIRMQ